MIFMARVGYDPNALTDYLGRLAKEQGTGAHGGFFATHPGMADRLTEAQAFVSANRWQRVNHEGRDQRFAAYRR
jgi:predicted Zn-dependent protease